MTIQKIYSAGDEIDSRCLKCKDTTNHTIIAMIGEQVAKVTCNTCGSRHNYRPLKSPKSGAKTIIKGKKTSTAGSRGSTRAAKERLKEEELKALAEKLDPSKAVAYSMTDSFHEHDLINHPKFGIGLVTAEIPPNKIEVRFMQEKKILICAPAAK